MVSSFAVINAELDIEQDVTKSLVKKVAESIIKMGIKSALFDRGGYKYHGRVQNVASGLREAGLVI